MSSNRLAGTVGLLHGAAALANTANALRPFTRGGPFAFPFFAAGALTTELPAAAAINTVAPQLALLAAGAARTRSGRAGLALSALAAAGLAGVAAASRPAEAILDRALVDALGADYRNAVRHPAWPGPDAPLSKRP